MSIAEKLTTIAENMQRVYGSGVTSGYVAGLEEGKKIGRSEGFDVGKQAGRTEAHALAWNAIQNNGERTNYRYGFGYWNLSNFFPLYDIKPKGSAQEMFRSTSGEPIDLTERLAECGVTLDTSGATNLDYAFFAVAASRIPRIDTTGCNSVNGIATSTENIVTIDEFVLREDGSQTITAPFDWSGNLTNLVVSGKIGKNGFSVAGCYALTRESLLSIINALQDKTGDTSGTQWVVTMGSANKAKLTAEELAIAQDKGWTVN